MPVFFRLPPARACTRPRYCSNSGPEQGSGAVLAAAAGLQRRHAAPAVGQALWRCCVAELADAATPAVTTTAAVEATAAPSADLVARIRLAWRLAPRLTSSQRNPRQLQQVQPLLLHCTPTAMRRQRVLLESPPQRQVGMLQATGMLLVWHPSSAKATPLRSRLMATTGLLLGATATRCWVRIVDSGGQVLLQTATTTLRRF